MINLLPTDINNSVTFARHNRTLLRWIVALLIGLVGAVIIVVAGMLYINYQVKAYSSQVAQTKEQLAKRSR